MNANPATLTARTDSRAARIFAAATSILKAGAPAAAGSVRVVPAHVVGATIQGGVKVGGSVALYAKFFEEPGVGGTRAHTIIATKARALKFMMHGREVYAKSVFSPGLMARPFLRPSLEENAGSIRDRLQAAIDHVCSRAEAGEGFVSS
jgi:hypothetical protein